MTMFCELFSHRGKKHELCLKDGGMSWKSDATNKNTRYVQWTEIICCWVCPRGCKNCAPKSSPYDSQNTTPIELGEIDCLNICTPIDKPHPLNPNSHVDWSKFPPKCTPKDKLLTEVTYADWLRCKHGSKGSALCLEYCLKGPPKISKFGFKWKTEVAIFEHPDKKIIAKFCLAIWQAIRGLVDRPRCLLVLINPKGGREKGVDIYHSEVAPIFARAGVNTKVVKTEYQGHAVDYLTQLTFGHPWDGVIAVGGDGLANEVATGLILARGEDKPLGLNVRMGIIPCGSTDATAFAIHGCNHVITAALHIVMGERRPIDIASLTLPDMQSRFCISVLSVGFLGFVLGATEDLKGVWGLPKSLVYVMAGVKGVVGGAKGVRLKICYKNSEQIHLLPQDLSELPPKSASCHSLCTLCTPLKQKRGAEDPTENELWKEVRDDFVSVSVAVNACPCRFAPYGIDPWAHLGDGLASVVCVGGSNGFDRSRRESTGLGRPSFESIRPKINRSSSFGYNCENYSDSLKENSDYSDVLTENSDTNSICVNEYSEAKNIENTVKIRDEIVSEVEDSVKIRNCDGEKIRQFTVNYSGNSEKYCNYEHPERYDQSDINSELYNSDSTINYKPKNSELRSVKNNDFKRSLNPEPNPDLYQETKPGLNKCDNSNSQITGDILDDFISLKCDSKIGSKPSNSSGDILEEIDSKDIINIKENRCINDIIDNEDIKNIKDCKVSNTICDIIIENTYIDKGDKVTNKPNYDLQKPNEREFGVSENPNFSIPKKLLPNEHLSTVTKYIPNYSNEKFSLSENISINHRVKNLPENLINSQLNDNLTENSINNLPNKKLSNYSTHENSIDSISNENLPKNSTNNLPNLITPENSINQYVNITENQLNNLLNESIPENSINLKNENLTEKSINKPPNEILNPSNSVIQKSSERQTIFGRLSQNAALWQYLYHTAVTGKATSLSHVKRIRSPEIEIFVENESNDAFETIFNCDGELIKTSNIKIKILQQHLPVFCRGKEIDE